jgi:hypothetical protein
MAQDPEERAKDILAEMERLVSAAEAQLEQSAEFRRQYRLDQIAVDATAAAEGRRLFEADMAAVDDDVNAARLRLQAPTISAPRRMRTMV